MCADCQNSRLQNDKGDLLVRYPNAMFLNRRVATHCWDLIFGWFGRQGLSLRMSVVEKYSYNIEEQTFWTKRSFVRFYAVYIPTDVTTFRRNVWPQSSSARVSKIEAVTFFRNACRFRSDCTASHFEQTVPHHVPENAIFKRKWLLVFKLQNFKNGPT
jgi:hypothetical protein